MKNDDYLKGEMEELKKSNKKMKVLLYVLLIIIFMGLCYAIGYFVGSNLEAEEVVDKDEEKDDAEKIELEKLDVNSEVVKKLFEIFREDTNCTKRYVLSNINTSMESKKYVAYLQLKSSDFSEMTCGSLDDSFVEGYYCAMNEQSSEYYGVNESKYEEAIANESTRTFEANVLETKYREIFGIDSQYVNGDFRISEGPIAHYDKVHNIYAEFGCECGGECALEKHVLISIEQNGNDLTLYTEYTSVENEISKINYNFTYEKETGNYIFVNREEK